MTAAKTPISVLQEMAQVQIIPPPVYDVRSKGNEFCVTLKLGKSKDIFTEAVALNKQLAKQLCAENALKLLSKENFISAHVEKQNISAKSCGLLSSSNVSSQNHVGKLNELCSKSMVATPQYNECGFENCEFIIECKMFDNTVTRGQSRIKKDAKQKSAEAMLKIYCERERFRYRSSIEFREVEYKYVYDESVKPSPLNAQFENHVGKLNEICSTRPEMIPSYTEYGTKNGEFIIECKFDNNITRGQSKAKKDAKQKAAEAMLNKIGEWGSKKTTNSFVSSDEIVNLFKSIKSIAPYENFVGKLIEICMKKMLPLPVFIEQVTGNGEFSMDCKVIYNLVSHVTQGQSRSKQGAKEKAAKKMLQILTEGFELESQNLMKSVTIVETVDAGQEKSTKILSEHITVVDPSDFSSVKYMTKEQLKMELNNLNVTYKITTISIVTNALMLKTNSTKNLKSFTFIAAGDDNEKIHLDLLRKAVFGMRILKADLT